MMMDVVRVVGPPLPRQLAHLSQGLYRAVIQLLAAHALGLVCCPIALIWGPLLSCKLTAPETAATPNSQEPESRQSTARTSVSTSGQNAKDSKDISKQISASQTSKANACLDPLSTQIYLRTNSNTEPTIAQRLRNPTRSESPSHDDRRESEDLSKSPNVLLDASKDRRKGPSFLSRFGMRSGWRKDDDMQDSDSDLGELRTDGLNARALTSVIGAGGGYIPLYKEPPRYIRVKSHNTKDRDFNRLFLAQELIGGKRAEQEPQRRAPQVAVGSKILRGGDAAIWAAEFSLDGRYLAVAGKDQYIRVFEVIATEEARKAHEEEEAQNGTAGEKLSAPVFRSKPVREFKGHTGDVLALSWSKNNFLLSSSMDKTVRLWHMSKAECLCTFAHKDLVTSIAFHPTDDRFFLAGSLDAQLRLWSIPDKSVAYSTSAGEFITAVAFTPDGKVAICGVLSGMCTFFDTHGLKAKYQIHVRSSRGKNAKGSKITGIRTMKIPGDIDTNRVKVLVTSNDSRIRVYDLNDKLLQVKFKGLENQSSQIHAHFSDDGKYVICGSEDRKAYIWPLGSPESEIRDKQPYESFDAHPEVVTNALMAPTATRQLLSASGDPIYDLCNPPPVMLQSLEESMASQTAFSDSSHGDTPVSAKRPEESPAYIERCKHFDGQIIVTTDRTGKIKVFRQDCAFAKRQQGLWETGSKFSGRISGVGRSASIMTRASTGSRIQSRRGSLSLGPNYTLQPQHASERINSWRHDIDGHRASISGTPTRSERSISPIKPSRTPLNTSAATLASEARKQPYTASPVNRNLHQAGPGSPASSTVSNRTTVRTTRDREQDKVMTGPPTPSFSLISASDSETKEEAPGGFWNLSRWRGNRNSAIYSSNGNGNASNSGVGQSRSSGQLLTPGEKSGPRMSMAVGDLNRLRVEDKASRRRSAGPAFSSRQSQSEPRASAVNDRLAVGDQLSISKKRVDSGVEWPEAVEVGNARNR